MRAMVESSPRRVVTQDVEKAADKDDRLFGHINESHKREKCVVTSRWRQLRTTVRRGGAAACGHAPLKREDSFLQRFSTRPPPEAREEASVGRRLPVLHPDESLLFCWLWMVTACALYYGWTLIARQAFPELRSSPAWAAADWCADAVYLLDVGVQFRTGHLEQGLVVREGKRLAVRYLRSRDFYLDVAALLPLDLILRSRGAGDTPLLRFPRFLKARRLTRLYYAAESRTAYPNLWRVANLVHVLLLLAHWFGCLYHLLAEHEGFRGAWAAPVASPEAEAARRYLASVYWSTLTLTTIGDLATPDTDLQYLFTIISYLIGVFIFATIVGQVGNVITNRNASRLEFERLLDGAKLYMRHHRVPKGMQRRVQRWYDYSWSRGRMQGGGDIHSALGILPDKLKTELAIHVNLKTLKKVSIFQACQPEFLHDLVLKMRAYIFTPGDLVCRRGEVARDMFIIADGLLHVINEAGQVLTLMKAGDFFGEIGILNLDGFNRRTADVRSVGYSELFSLSREDVLSAMKDYPEAEEILQSMGRKRLMEARMSHPAGNAPYDSDENMDKRQRKKGLSWPTWLRNKSEPEQSAKVLLSPIRKFTFSEERQSSMKTNHLGLNSPKADTLGTSSKVNSVVSNLTLRFKRPPKDERSFKVSQSLKDKRTIWCRISGLIRKRRRRKVPELIRERSPQGPTVPPTQRPSCLKVASRLPDIPPPVLQLELTAHQSSTINARRTSWNPQKRSVSNWNRSELFSESLEPSFLTNKNRRMTLAEGMLLGSRITQDRSRIHKSVPATLMTGSGLNTRCPDTPPSLSPEVSPMSSNYSLTPSTSEDEEDVPDVSVHELEETILPLFSVKMQDYVARIVQDLKTTMDSYIVETEKDLCLRILQLEKQVREKDDIISQLHQECERKFGPIEQEPEEPTRADDVAHHRASQDSAICSIDISPPEQVRKDSFHADDLWLVEFPLKSSSTLAPPQKKLRRHSSVEVGCRSPYFPLDGRPATRESLCPPPPLRSPRRFSESQARSDILSTSFAARVRRVFAKVKATRIEEEATRRSSIASPNEMSMQRMRQPLNPARRLLPTITESCSFDSLRSVPGALEGIVLPVPQNTRNVIP